MPTNIMRRSILALAVSVPTASVTFSAHSVELEEIIVTAQFREQNVQDTPISVTAMSAEMINARAQNSLVDIAKQAPNVSLAPSQGSFGPSMSASIRGVGQYDFVPALEPGVGIYIDDVYFGSLTGSMFDLLDLDRVEVLRGPQGTLSGKNSIGGAIKLFSSKPMGSDDGFLSVTTGSYNRTEIKGSADFAITDKLAARISGISRQRDGYIDRVDYGCENPGSGIAPVMSVGSDCVMADEGNEDVTGIRAMFLYTVSDDLEILISADRTESESYSLGGVLLQSSGYSGANIATDGGAHDDRFVTAGTYKNYSTYSQPGGSWVGGGLDGYPLFATASEGKQSVMAEGASVKVTWDLNETMNLESITAYRTYDAMFSNEDDMSPYSIALGITGQNYDQYTQEFRLNGTLANEAINYTVGAFYFESESDVPNFQDFRYLPFPLQFNGGSFVDADTQAVFANMSWDLSDQLTLNLGLRYTEEEKTLSFERSNKDGTPNPFVGALDGVSSTYSGENLDYRANVQYRINEQAMVYGGVSTGVKGGGVNPRPFFEEQTLTFDQEEVTAYELGIKTDLFDKQLRVNAAVFFNDYKDIQLTLPNCNSLTGTNGINLGDQGLGAPCAKPHNAGDAEVQGLEVEVLYQNDSGLMVDASFSKLDFEYTRLAEDLGGTIPEDGISVYTPETKASLGVGYEIIMSSGAVLTPRADISYQSEFYVGPANNDFAKLDGYSVANLRLSWLSADQGWEAALGVTNLADKYYYVSGLDLSGASGMVSAVPARPREWYLSLQKNF